MLSITRQGSIAAVIAAANDVPAKLVPYAASTALTRTAKLAQAGIMAAMPRVFDRPTAYTLGGTRVVPSTITTLAARVMVKDQASGQPQQSYLLPEVRGGARDEKRFERVLRQTGILRSGESAVPGKGAPRDAAGNLSRSVINSVLQGLAGQVRAAKTTQAKARLAKRKNELFAGTPRGGSRPAGVWRREGKSLRLMLLFTKTAPVYTKRLDFEAIAEQAAREHFRPEFERALGALLLRKR